jgi:hypothetical protein
LTQHGLNARVWNEIKRPNIFGGSKWSTRFRFYEQHHI